MVRERIRGQVLIILIALTVCKNRVFQFIIMPRSLRIECPGTLTLKGEDSEFLLLMANFKNILYGVLSKSI